MKFQIDTITLSEIKYKQKYTKFLVNFSSSTKSSCHSFYGDTNDKENFN